MSRLPDTLMPKVAHGKPAGRGREGHRQPVPGERAEAAAERDDRQHGPGRAPQLGPPAPLREHRHRSQPAALCGRSLALLMASAGPSAPVSPGPGAADRLLSDGLLADCLRSVSISRHLRTSEGVRMNRTERVAPLPPEERDERQAELVRRAGAERASTPRWSATPTCSATSCRSAGGCCACPACRPGSGSCSSCAPRSAAGRVRVVPPRRIGRAAGLDDADLDLLARDGVVRRRRRRAHGPADPRGRRARRRPRAQRRDLGRAGRGLPVPQVIEICMLVGEYAMLAGALNSLGVQIEEGYPPGTAMDLGDRAGTAAGGAWHRARPRPADRPARTRGRRRHAAQRRAGPAARQRPRHRGARRP